VTIPGIGLTLASDLIRRALVATCGCAARRWKIDLSRSFAGVAIRAEVRSD
jgi:hypothetical protein